MISRSTLALFGAAGLLVGMAAAGADIAGWQVPGKSVLYLLGLTATVTLCAAIAEDFSFRSFLKLLGVALAIVIPVGQKNGLVPEGVLPIAATLAIVGFVLMTTSLNRRAASAA